MRRPLIRGAQRLPGTDRDNQQPGIDAPESYHNWNLKQI
jgi:hypothetical protein